MKKYSIVILLASFQLFFLQAQERDIAKQFHSWWTVSGNHKVAQDWSIHTLVSHRLHDFVKDRQQTLIRAGVNYHLRKEISFTLGYDWVKTFPYGEQPLAKDVIEQRIFEQFQLKQKIGRIGLRHRYRLEHRFIDLGDNMFVRHRFRYLFGMNIPLNKNKIEAKTVFLSFFNELFISFAQETHPNYFNQNWSYGGVAYRIDHNKIVSLGYMMQYFPKGSSDFVESNHTLMVSYAHNLNLIPKKKKRKAE